MMTKVHATKYSHYHCIQHGVLLAIRQQGILLLGDAGIGKSSLALELLYQRQDYRLVADDSIEITRQKDQLLGRCPALSEGMLHTRELGLISVTQLFGSNAWQKQVPIDYVVQLHHEKLHTVEFDRPTRTFTLLAKRLPLLLLDIHNPAPLAHRLLCWLQMQTMSNKYSDDFKRQQQYLMTT